MIASHHHQSRDAVAVKRMMMSDYLLFCYYGSFSNYTVCHKIGRTFKKSCIIIWLPWTSKKRFVSLMQYIVRYFSPIGVLKMAIIFYLYFETYCLFLLMKEIMLNVKSYMKWITFVGSSCMWGKHHSKQTTVDVRQPVNFLTFFRTMIVIATHKQTEVFTSTT